MKYFVKTRNWHRRRWVFRLLALTRDATHGDSYTDGDGKFCLDTNSPLRAWATWAYWMLLRHWSGGWTYIIRNRATFKGYGGTYKSIY